MLAGASRPHTAAASYEGFIRHVKAFLSSGEVSFFQKMRHPLGRGKEALHSGIILCGFGEEFLTPGGPRG
jgi:hypothetical protein